MVACPHDYPAVTHWYSDCYRWWFGGSSVYLHPVLSMDVSEKVKAQLVIVTGLVVLYFVFKSPWWLYAAAAVGLLSIVIPAVGDLIVKAWFKVAEILGNINGKIILSVMFFVFLWPIAMLYRLTTKNPLAIKRTDDSSFYTERNHQYTKDDLEQTW